MGKELFDITGSNHTTVAKGSHDLSKQGAKLVDCVQDILDELKDLPVMSESSRSPSFSRASTEGTALQDSGSDRDEQNGLSLQVIDHLGHDPVGLDELQIRSGLPTAQLQAELFQLELSGALGRLPGGLYQKLKRPVPRHPSNSH